MASIEYYSKEVKALMYNDVFLAFNNIDKRMNNPEVYERINEKMTLLGPSVGRYIAEVLQPIIVRTIGILYRKGKLPEPPEEFLMSPEYEVECVSQLAQAQKRNELNALTTGLSMIGQMAQFVPDVLDKISPDEIVEEVWSVAGAPVKLLRTDEQVAEIRQAKADAAAQQQQMNQLQQGAGIVEQGSKIAMNVSKAKGEK
jgi:hypothetical protein